MMNIREQRFIEDLADKLDVTPDQLQEAIKRAMVYTNTRAVDLRLDNRSFWMRTVEYQTNEINNIELREAAKRLKIRH